MVERKSVTKQVLIDDGHLCFLPHRSSSLNLEYTDQHKELNHWHTLVNQNQSGTVYQNPPKSGLVCQAFSGLVSLVFPLRTAFKYVSHFLHSTGWVPPVWVATGLFGSMRFWREQPFSPGSPQEVDPQGHEAKAAPLRRAGADDGLRLRQRRTASWRKGEGLFRATELPRESYTCRVA